jgi:hypothetical protein
MHTLVPASLDLFASPWWAVGACVAVLVLLMLSLFEFSSPNAFLGRILAVSSWLLLASIAALSPGWLPGLCLMVLGFAAFSWYFFGLLHGAAVANGSKKYNRSLERTMLKAPAPILIAVVLGTGKLVVALISS